MKINIDIVRMLGSHEQSSGKAFRSESDMLSFQKKNAGQRATTSFHHAIFAWRGALTTST